MNPLDQLLDRREQRRSRRDVPTEQLSPAVQTVMTALVSAVAAGDLDAGDQAESALVAALAGQTQTNFHGGVRRPIRPARTASVAMATHIASQRRWR
jgi:hypothetical protein